MKGIGYKQMCVRADRRCKKAVLMTVPATGTRDSTPAVMSQVTSEERE